LLAGLALEARDRSLHPLLDPREALLDLGDRSALVETEALDRVIQLVMILASARG